MREYTWNDRVLYIDEPTVEEMAKVGELIKPLLKESMNLDIEKVFTFVCGNGLIEMLRIIVKTKDNKPVDVEKINYKLAQEIVKDFFSDYEPYRWIYGNMHVLGLAVSEGSSGSIQEEQ